MKNKIALLIPLITLGFTNIKPNHIIFNEYINDYNAIVFNPAYIHHDDKMANFNFGYNIIGNFNNNALSIDWLNNSLFAGKKLNNQNEKNKFLEVFDNNDILISDFAQFQFGMNYKDYSLTTSFETFGTIIIPYSIIDMTFNGLEFDKNLTLDTDESRFQSIMPIAFAHSFIIDKYLSKMDLPINNVKFGFSTKLLLGMSYFESGFNNSLIDSSPDSVYVKGNINSKYSLFGSELVVDDTEYGNSEFKSNTKFGFPGKGFAIDLGLSADVSENFNFGISFNNLLGTITWDEASTYEYNMDYNLNISSDEFEEIAGYSDEQQDSLTTSMISNESNKSIPSFKSKYPSYLFININYRVKDFLISSSLLNPLNNVYYKDFEFTSGVTYDRFKKMPLYFQYGFNGDKSYTWLFGLNFNFKNYDLKIGMSQKDGFFNTAKGISFGISQTFKFNKKKKQKEIISEPYEIDQKEAIPTEKEPVDENKTLEENQIDQKEDVPTEEEPKNRFLDSNKIQSEDN